jgi:hypothetical protein
MKREKNTIGEGMANFSLLHPPGVPLEGEESVLGLSLTTAHDLGLDEIVAALAHDRGHQREIRELLSRLPRDPQVITYRQEVLEDMLASPALAQTFASMLPVLDSLFHGAHHAEREMTWLHEVVWRAGELQNIIDCFERLGTALASAEESIRSEGLRLLQAEIRQVRDDPTYQRLLGQLPGLLAKLQSKASLTIGVNLDASLRPFQATLLSVNDEPFTDQSLLNRLFGRPSDREGIAPLHSVPSGSAGGPYTGPVDPFMVPLFADLASVLEKTAIPVADQLRQYAGLHRHLFTNLRQGLVFYLGAIRLIRRLREQGLSMCRPQIALAGERRCEVRDSYNVNLVLKHLDTYENRHPAVVTNDIHIGPEGHIHILTGPNRGGKTTYIQGVGLIHILAQAGCYVPGTEAVISPLDHLFTHFPTEEKPESDAGRFGEEALRLGEIFYQVTSFSLVLMNESLSSTSFSESLYLAQDLVRILRQVGARAVYATHLHELGNQVQELNDSVPGESRIVSVVSSPVEAADGEKINRSYKLEFRPPLGQSYAREIAARYGISYQQLVEALSQRGLL